MYSKIWGFGITYSVNDHRDNRHLRSLTPGVGSTPVCAAQQGMCFASLTLEQGTKITLSLWKRLYFTSGLTLEQGRFFPEIWLITIKYSYETPLHSLFALWLIGDNNSLEKCIDIYFTFCVFSGTGCLFLQCLSGTGSQILLSPSGTGPESQDPAAHPRSKFGEERCVTRQNGCGGDYNVPGQNFSHLKWRYFTWRHGHCWALFYGSPWLAKSEINNLYRLKICLLVNGSFTSMQTSPNHCFWCALSSRIDNFSIKYWHIMLEILP